MPSKSMAIYATAAIASIITYVITAFSRGTTPSNAHEVDHFFLNGISDRTPCLGDHWIYRGLSR